MTKTVLIFTSDEVADLKMLRDRLAIQKEKRPIAEFRDGRIATPDDKAFSHVAFEAARCHAVVSRILNQIK